MVLTLRTVWALLVGLVPLVIWPRAGTVLLWALAVLAIALVDRAMAPRPDSLELTRTGPLQVRLEESVATELLVTNPGTRTARGTLRDAWPPSAGATPAGATPAGAPSDRHEVAIPPGERRRLTTMLTPTRRGDRRADLVTIRLLGPLGLAGRQASLSVPGTIRVLHPFHSRRHLPSKLSHLRMIDGRSAVRRRGQGTEFDSLRDYVDGDDVRSIDWRATARRGNVVVRTWQPEQHRRIVLVIDTSRTSAGRVGDVPRLDAAMDAALLLTALAGHAHDRVQVIAGDQVVKVRVGGAERGSLLSDVVSALAPLDATLVEADWEALVNGLVGRGQHRALVVLLTPLEPAAVEEGLLPVLPLLVARHRVVVASVADPAVSAMRERRDSVEQVYAAAAAERTTALRQRTGAALERLGVDVIDADAEHLPAKLADHYLWLKSEGLL